MKVKFDDSIRYIRVQSIDEIDFESLSDEHLRQFAKGIARLIGKKDSDEDCSQSE